MGSDILGVSITGLKVSQNALRTAGHNIANADTEGYSRQRTEVNALAPSFTGAGYVGNGAYTASIERIVNGFVDERVIQDTSYFNQLNTFNNKSLELNNILANENTSLTNGFNSFFAAAQNATDDPTSIPARQLMLSETDSLVSQFTTLHSRISDVEQGVENDIKNSVNQINQLAGNISLLNRRILDASGNSSAVPNDLLDQRQQVINELSKLVDVKTFEQSDGQMNLIIGGSQTLVLGAESRQIAVGPNQFDATQSEIYFINDGVRSDTPITDKLNGGQIKGLIDFRNGTLPSAYNELGRLSLVIADQFNQLQVTGIDLDNQFGQNLFADINRDNQINARVFSNQNNQGGENQQLTLRIDDTTELTASNYELAVDPTRRVYTITRLSDGQELIKDALPEKRPSEISFDGLTLSIVGGELSPGDRFLIKPTENASAHIDRILESPRGLALGTPVMTTTGNDNIGSGVVDSGEVLSLVDQNGDVLPLLAQSGQLSPPLVVRFNSSTSYDILDNSDPTNPVSLSPPMNNLSYIPGSQNALFPDDLGGTRIVSNGVAIGLPLGRESVNQASLQAGTSAPDYTVTDFSTAANQFSFDVVVSNTTLGASDSTTTVTINNPSITDNASLLAAINQDLSGRGVTAYIDDAGQLAFSLDNAGFGDITVNNYDGDPDGATTAPAGQANALLGFTIETGSQTTVANAQGLSGRGISGNGYPAEAISISTINPSTGSITKQNVFTQANASANETAGLLDNINGVSASARTQVNISEINAGFSAPLQLSLNGQALIPYTADSVTGNPVLDATVPSPTINGGEDLNNYLAERINTNPALSALNISAKSVFDATTGDYTLQVTAAQGHDVSVDFTGAAGDSVQVGDTTNPGVTLTGSGNSVASSITVGGELQIDLSDNLSLTTLPPNSLLLGDSQAANFAQSSYLGVQMTMSGTPSEGDTFTLDFNTNAVLDNRNGLAMSALRLEGIVGPENASFSNAYNVLIEQIAIEASASKINTEAAEQVLEQTTALRNSISGVNLDEEAANLIKFEQLYAANARVITVARDLFDQLLNSV